jgi:hypothetical protein
MSKTYVFYDAHITFDDGDKAQVMYLHNDFIFLAVGDFDISFLPLSLEKKKELFDGVGDKFEELTDMKTILRLGTILEGRDAETELKKMSSHNA